MVMKIPDLNLPTQGGDTKTGRQQLSGVPSSAGEGLQLVGQGLQMAGAVQLRIDKQQAAEEQQIANKINRSAAYDTYSLLQKKTRELEGNYLGRKLGAAAGVYGEASEAIEQAYKEHHDLLQNDDQKLMFDTVARAHQNTFLRSIQTHERIQIEQWDKKSGEIQVNDSVDAAIDHYLDADAAGVAKDGILIGIERMLPGEENSEIRKQVYDAKVSDLHKGIIKRYLVNDPLGAKGYYDAVAKEISPDAKAEIELKVNAGVTEQLAQSQTDMIVDSGIAFPEQLKEARKIKDPKIRTLVTNGIKIRKQEADFIKKQTYADFVDTVTKSALTAPSVEAALRLSRNPDLKAADQLGIEKIIKDRFVRKARGDINTDLRVYADAREKIDSGEIKNITQLQKYFSGLSNADWKKTVDYFEAGGIQGKIKDSDVRTAFTSLTNGTAGDNPGLYGSAWNAVESFAVKTGKIPSDSEMRKIIAKTLSEEKLPVVTKKKPDLTSIFTPKAFARTLFEQAASADFLDLEKEEQEKIFNDFNLQLADKVEAFENSKGGKATRQELQKLVNDMLTPITKIDPGFFYDTTIQGFSFEASDAEVDKRLKELKLAITEKNRKLYREKFLKITDENL